MVTNNYNMILKDDLSFLIDEFLCCFFVLGSEVHAGMGPIRRSYGRDGAHFRNASLKCPSNIF